MGPRYVPFDGSPQTISMGLRPLGTSAWLEPDAHRADDLAAKAALLRTRHGDVVATLPVADDASAETFALVKAEVEARGLTDRALVGDVLFDDLHPIDAAGRLVQEDLCVMVRDTVHEDGTGTWILGAASVCSPSRWALTEKLGQDLAAIHGPVPDYETIEHSTDRFFDRISVDRPVWRTNWTLLDDATPFQPSSPGPAEALAVDPADVVLRVERQTLRRLPETGAVLFTIRTYIDRIGSLRPEARADLRGTLAEVPESVVAYRGWQQVLPAVRAWLAVT